MKIRKWLWNLFLTLLALSVLAACQPQAPATVVLPTFQPPTQPVETEEAPAANETPVGVVYKNWCAEPPHKYGFEQELDCLAINPEDGTYYDPSILVGCDINGQKYGSPDLGSPVQDIPTVKCNPPLVSQAMVLENLAGENLQGSSTRFGPGSVKGDTGIYFVKNAWGIPNLALVNVVGCFKDLTGYMETELEQYTQFGGPTTVPYTVTDRVLVEYQGVYGWGWSGSYDAAPNGVANFADGFTPVCPERK